MIDGDADGRQLVADNKVAYKRLVGGIDFVDATRVKTSSVVCFGIVLGR